MIKTLCTRDTKTYYISGSITSFGVSYSDILCNYD